MKINRVRPLAPLVRIMAGGMALTMAHLAFAAGPGWVASFEQAMQMARQQGKPIFVDFSTSWCGVCKQMDRSTLADPVIIQRLDNFVKVKVDGDARQDLCSAYGVMAYPTFIHLDPNGRVLDKREGFMRVQELVSTLDRVYQTVAASSTAIAQAKPQEQQQERPAPGGNGEQRAADMAVSTAGNQLLSAPDAPAGRETRTVAQTATRGRETAQISTENVSFDKSDPRLKGSVYAMGASPTSERRSRFGGSSAGQSELRELAEATAQPGAIEQSDSSAEKPAAESELKLESLSVKKTDDAEDTKAAADAKKAADEAKAKETADKAEESKKLLAETKAKADADAKALAEQPKTVASASPSPVIESRLTGLSDAELPKPLLSRTVSGASQKMTPTAAVSGGATGDPLATIRRIRGENPAEPAADPKLPAKTQEIAAAKSVEKPAAEAKTEKPAAEAKAEKPATEAKAETAAVKAEDESAKKPATEVAQATDKKQADATSGSSKEESSKPAPDKEAADSGAKTEEGASRSDIERWMKEADSKLVADKKKEARAMYTKVVEKDPKNQFGKSDMAYVKMVSLIVDKDSDLLRRQAYNKIKEFEARFPESEHKDYYTLIRAILALDLGETNEAHRLLGTYAERFPESKYRKMAHDTWKDLPPVKKESNSSKSSSSSSKSSRSSADSSSKRKSSDG